jgi:hypothetical protein
VEKLPKMVNGYQAIVESGPSYFDILHLSQKERLTYPRLANLCEFYAAHTKSQAQPIRISASQSVREWIRKRDETATKEFELAIKTAIGQTSWAITFPTAIHESQSVRTAILGIQGIDFNDDGDMRTLLFAMLSIIDMNLHFLVIVVGDADKNVVYSLRFQKEYFVKLNESLLSDAEGLDTTVLPTPLPLVPDPELLVLIAGFKLQTVSPKMFPNYFTMMSKVWQLSEYRSRLSSTNQIEIQWLMALENEYQWEINKNLEIVRQAFPQSFPGQEIVDIMQSTPLPIDQQDLIAAMTEMSLLMNKKPR